MREIFARGHGAGCKNIGHTPGLYVDVHSTLGVLLVSTYTMLDIQHGHTACPYNYHWPLRPLYELCWMFVMPRLVQLAQNECQPNV